LRHGADSAAASASVGKSAEKMRLIMSAPCLKAWRTSKVWRSRKTALGRAACSSFSQLRRTGASPFSAWLALTLAGFEARVCFVDHVQAATTADNAVVAVALLQGFQ